MMSHLQNVDIAEEVEALLLYFFRQISGKEDLHVPADQLRDDTAVIGAFPVVPGFNNGEYGAGTQGDHLPASKPLL